MTIIKPTNISYKGLVESVCSIEKERKISLDSKESSDLILDEQQKELPSCDVQNYRISYCTLYLDFDSHSDKYHSDLVYLR